MTNENDADDNASDITDENSSCDEDDDPNETIGADDISSPIEVSHVQKQRNGI